MENAKKPLAWKLEKGNPWKDKGYRRLRQKSWMKKYGLHVVVCVVAIGIAFWVNRKTNIDRSHVYVVSEPIYTLLGEITEAEAEAEGDALIFSGWGFDTDYHSEDSTCELILQDIETGEALWPKMEKNPEPAQVPERYTGGEDCSAAGFEGSLKADRLRDDSVYEVLLRYTASYADENGKGQPYVRTVTTGKFLYQGRMTGYNPKTFKAPEIAGSELGEELEGTRLFHHFPEGMWVYYDEETLYYVVDNSILEDGKGTSFPVLWFSRDMGDLPEANRGHGFGNNAFYVWENEVICPDIVGYRAWSIPMPSDKVTYISTGLYDDADKSWVCNIKKQVGDVVHE